MYNNYDNNLIIEIINKIDNGYSKLSLSKEYNIPRGTINYSPVNKISCPGLWSVSMTENSSLCLPQLQLVVN